ncbi:MAG: class I SAM-dependent methyltransferase [Chitinophagales bacterium]
MRHQKSWFETWFNRHYYDLLYQHRDEDEAAGFLDGLISYLHPTTGATMLDAACGKGRHASYLAQKGFEVTGIDLSSKNIKEAAINENDHLSFFQHDMRRVFRINYFDFIFNFYTSFGYFDNKKYDIMCMQSFAAGLKKGGRLVIDFFNVSYVLKHLVEDESKVVNGVHFTITKKYEDCFISKKIDVMDGNKREIFCEKVRALQLNDFNDYFTKSGLKLITTFGDYQLNPYDESVSERLILIAEK